jgi:hypothetical protein
MSTRIYKEAIEEASDLIRMAEENAKNKLIEAFAPRIRAMVEKSLFESSEEGAGRDDEMDDLLLSMEEESEEDSDEDTDEVPSQETPPVQDFQLEQPLAAEMQSSGVDLHIPTGVKSVTLQMEGEDMELTSESIESLLRIVDGQPSMLDRAKGLRLELKMLGRALNALNEGTTPKSAALQIVEEFNAILRKSIGLKQELQESKGASNEAAKIEFSQLLKEISEMSTRTLLRNLLRESTDFSLYEAEEEEDMDMVSAEEAPADEESEEESEEEVEEEGSDVDVDAIKAAVEQLASALGMDLSSEEEESEEEEEEEESKEEGEQHEMHYEMDDQEEMHMEVDHADETVYEIDESVIAQALVEARKKRAKLGESDMAHHFGGGAKAKDVKLNALSEKEKMGGKPKKEAKKPEDAVKGMEKAEEVKQEARNNRSSQARLEEAVQAAETLRRQLSEQKLFNAKLLYVNKLMQNRALSDKQLKSVVEAIDSAKTIREAKLLYTSLSESLVTTGGRLAESARNAGGSSRPVRSGAMLNESGGDVDRWARLAGLVSE